MLGDPTRTPMSVQAIGTVDRQAVTSPAISSGSKRHAHLPASVPVQETPRHLGTLPATPQPVVSASLARTDSPHAELDAGVGEAMSLN